MKILSLLICLIPLTSSAFLATSESADVLPMNQYKITAEPQFRISDSTGINITSHFDMAYNEENSMRASLGFGDTDFYAGASWKWVPIPDYRDQPAMGLKFEGLVGRETNETLFGLRVHPIISKKWDTKQGLFIPYASIPVGWQNFMSKNDINVQLVGGSEYKNHDWKQWSFGVELGLNVNKAFSYFMGYASFYFDRDSGVRTKR